ncbi:MAG TPA: hypothetical protein VEH27_12245 [Methylomirabilota bacterium]|nr:hypothetical protein [Methylomirabilota bacterium]
MSRQRAIQIFATTMAFLMVFVPFALVGVLLVPEIWDGFKVPHPIAASVAGVVFAIISVGGGIHSARRTAREYQPRTPSHSAGDAKA